MERIMKHAYIALLLLTLAACTTPRPAEQTAAKPTFQHVDPTTLSSMLQQQDYLLINTHIPYDGEIAGTDAFLPYDQPEQLLAGLPSDKQAPIVLYCRTGRMSTIAAQTITQAGYTNVFELDGGMIAWQRAGFALEQK
jgi:phage shock protein E